MAFGLVGEVPGMNMPLAVTKVNEALGDIYDRQYWSFQFQESGWLTPGLQFPVQGSTSVGQSAGTITTTAYSDQVVGTHRIYRRRTNGDRPGGRHRRR